jgi:hypothetical protein
MPKTTLKSTLKPHNIPTYFYQCFFGELIKVFGVKFLIPDDDYSYMEQLTLHLDQLGGTGGWHIAFKEACDQCDIISIYADYSQMNWIHSDIFDGYIADEMIEVLFADTKHNDYYKFKIQKERELCKE